MQRFDWLIVLPLLLAPLGCLTEDEQTTLVSPNPFVGPLPQPVPTRAMKSVTEVKVETAARVDSLGRRILAANQQIGLRPLFQVIGAPQPEIFHIQTASVVVTDGLVNRCKSDGELAAVLCLELGKMVAEREALTGPDARSPDKLPPINVPVGNDSGGTFGAPDGTHLAELAKYGRAPVRTTNNRATPKLPPDPHLLARAYLAKVGYAASELEAVAPLLQAADKNSSWEKQLSPNGPMAPARPWSH